MACPDNRPIHFRLPDKDLAAVEEWRRRQPQIPGRSEALRVLIRQGLRNSGCEVAA